MSQDGRPSVRLLTATAWASLLLFAGSSAVVSVPLKDIGADMNVGFVGKGLLAASRSCMLAIATFCMGYGADRVGKRWFLSGGMLLAAAALLWMGTTATYIGLVAGAMALGAGLASLEGLASPLVAELHPKTVATQMNVLHAFFSAGLAASSLFVGWALQGGASWHVLLKVTAGPALVIAAAFAVGRYPDAEVALRPAPLRIRDILGNRALWPLAVAMALTAGCEGALLVWTPNFIQDEYGSTALVGSYGLAVFAGTMAVGRFGTGAAARFVPLPRLMVGLALAGAAATSCLALFGSLWVSLAALVAAGLCIACFWPSILSVAASRLAVGSATLLATLSVAGIAGFAALPLAIGVIAQVADLRVGFLLVPGALLTAAAVLRSASATMRPIGSP